MNNTSVELRIRSVLLTRCSISIKNLITVFNGVACGLRRNGKAHLLRGLHKGFYLLDSARAELILKRKKEREIVGARKIRWKESRM